MRKVLVNVSFRDKYNKKKVYAAGKTYDMTEERIKEIKEVDPNFVTVISQEEKKKTEEKVEEEVVEIVEN